jgi:hypothetical protein
MKNSILLLVAALSLSLAAGRETAATPGWKVLTALTPAERENARIDFELDARQPEPVVALARAIESLWNSGRYDAALARLPGLAAQTGDNCPAVGIAWRNPIPSPAFDFNPFTVSDRDSVYVVDFEVDWRLTRRFFCVLALQGDGMPSRMSVNFSTDLGNTWSEVFVLSGYNYLLNDVAGRIMLSRYWLVYTGGANNAPNHALWCRQFMVSDGTPDTFRSGSVSDNFYNTPTRDTVRELAMASNQLPANGTIYLLALMSSDSLRYFTLPVSNDTAWHNTALPWADAMSGLDACWPADWLSGDSALLFVSYLTTSDSVRILREILGGTWQRYRSVYAVPLSSVTSVAAYRDTVICAYSDNGRIRYQIRRGSGPWAVGEPPQDTTQVNTIPDVCAQGGYFHFVYRASTSYGWYTRRPYSGFTWEAVQRFDGTFHVAYNIHPDVRWIGRGDTAGVVWVSLPSNAGRARYAYFDYSGVAETPGTPVVDRRLSARPVPGGVLINYALERSAPVTLRVCDAAGRTLYAWRGFSSAGNHDLFWPGSGSGVRFFQLDAMGRRTTVKLSLAR